MAGPPNPMTLTKLQTFLRHGRYDYDWVSSRIYAACYNDPHVMEKILAADPKDAPSSASASEESSEVEVEGDVDSDSDAYKSEEDNAEPPVLAGSKENPVILEGDETEDGAKENSLGKRKRLAPDVEESTSKKSKSGETLFCLNCGGKYDPAKNKDGACRYHAGETVLGELELNPIDDQINDDEPSRQTWPNAFHWECCETNFEDFEESNRDKPCETGRHRAGEGDQTEYVERYQRKRYHRRYYG